MYLHSFCVSVDIFAACACMHVCRNQTSVNVASVTKENSGPGSVCSLRLDLGNIP